MNATAARAALPLVRLRPRPLFIATIFLGSFLLFLVQPMFARLVLPRLGGAPSVWTTAMLCYQAMLLGGYLYAHALGRLAPRRQLVIHVALFAVAAFTLPIGIAAVPDGWQRLDPAFWLIGLFLLSIGPVFFAVAAQAPLMQLWFSRTGDPSAGSPYFLYAASNGGSLLALVLYPLLVEPTLTLPVQTGLWSAGFLCLIALIVLCGLVSTAAPAAPIAAPPVPGPQPAGAPAPAAPATTAWPRKLRWVLLAAVPSGLMLSTTTHLTTDIMAMPLFWVVPLALYLVTFIIAFSGAADTFHATRLAPVLLLVLGSYVFMAEGIIAFLMAMAGLVLFFYVALALHGELARLQPPVGELTSYYLWVSVGGALGGLFCGLIAPFAFDWLYEHPILLVASAALLPARALTPRLGRLWRGRLRPFLRYALPPVTLIGSLVAGGALFDGGSLALIYSITAAIALAAVIAIGRPFAFAFHYGMLLMALGGWAMLDTSSIPWARERSFFGIYTIEGSRSTASRKLLHGTTLHGAQSLLPELATMPMSYYAPDSGVGLAMREAPRLFGPDARIGFVGLGAGTLSCYAQPRQRWTAYEIDPLVVRIARSSGLFTYIRRCKPDLDIVLGDARLSLAEAPGRSLDVLALDAFSSDAIPLHLMTKQAFAIYRRVLAPDGLLLVHISNRFLDLEPVVAAIAHDAGWHARLMDYRPKDPGPGEYFTRAVWIAMSPSPATIDTLVAATPALRTRPMPTIGSAATAVVATGNTSPSDEGDWRLLRRRLGFPPWTDDFASILSLLKG